MHRRRSAAPRRASLRRAAQTVCLAAGLGLAAAPAVAEDPYGDSRPLDRRFLEEQLIDKEMRQAIQQLLLALGPVVDRMSQLFKDIPQYEAPEILPNGDIIIRRKRPKAEGEIET